MMKRETNRVAHVRRTHMGHEGAVAEPDQRVDHGFRMYQHFDLIRGNAKELTRFNNFQRLIEHRGGIDGDPLPHLPVRMTRGLGQRRVVQLVHRPVAKGTATCGDHDPFNGRDIFADQGLKDGGMLAVDGKERGPVTLCRLQNQFTGTDQRFLVRKRQCRALLQRSQTGGQPRRADNR